MKLFNVCKINKNVKYKLFCSGFYYYLIHRKKIIYKSVSFIDMYSFILKYQIDIRNVSLPSMSLNDFFNDFACFDDKIKGGGFI